MASDRPTPPPPLSTESPTTAIQREVDLTTPAPEFSATTDSIPTLQPTSKLTNTGELSSAPTNQPAARTESVSSPNTQVQQQPALEPSPSVTEDGPGQPATDMTQTLDTLSTIPAAAEPTPLPSPSVAPESPTATPPPPLSTESPTTAIQRAIDSTTPAPEFSAATDSTPTLQRASELTNTEESLSTPTNEPAAVADSQASPDTQVQHQFAPELDPSVTEDGSEVPATDMTQTLDALSAIPAAAETAPLSSPLVISESPTASDPPTPPSSVSTEFPTTAIQPQVDSNTPAPELSVTPAESPPAIQRALELPTTGEPLSAPTNQPTAATESASSPDTEVQRQPAPELSPSATEDGPEAPTTDLTQTLDALSAIPIQAEAASEPNAAVPAKSLSGSDRPTPDALPTLSTGLSTTSNVPQRALPSESALPAASGVDPSTAVPAESPVVDPAMERPFLSDNVTVQRSVALPQVVQDLGVFTPLRSPVQLQSLTSERPADTPSNARLPEPSVHLPPIPLAHDTLNTVQASPVSRDFPQLTQPTPVSEVAEVAGEEIYRQGESPLPEANQSLTIEQPAASQGAIVPPQSWDSIADLLDQTAPSPPAVQASPEDASSTPRVPPQSWHSIADLLAQTTPTSTLQSVPEDSSSQERAATSTPSAQEKARSVVPAIASPEAFSNLHAADISQGSTLQRQTTARQFSSLSPTGIQRLATDEGGGGAATDQGRSGENDKAAGGASSQLEKLAQAMYQMVRQRLAIERERLGRSGSGRFQ